MSNTIRTSGEKALTKSQVDKLLSVITDINHEALIRLAICSGIRREDLVGIKTKDVNTVDNSITF